MANRDMRNAYNFDEAKLKAGQRDAALRLVERDFAGKGERQSMQAIADELGIARSTLYNWTNSDSNFIEYKNFVAQDFVNTYLPFVYAKLIEGISNGSMRGIELFLKRAGDLDSRSEINLTNNEGQGTFDERKKDLLARIQGSQEEQSLPDTKLMEDEVIDKMSDSKSGESKDAPKSKDG